MEEKRESAFESIASIRNTLETIADAAKDTWSPSAKRWLLPGVGPEYQIYDFAGSLEESFKVNKLRKALRWIEFNIPDGSNHRERTLGILDSTLTEINEIENQRPRNPFRWADESISDAAAELVSELHEVVDYLDCLLNRIDPQGEYQDKEASSYWRQLHTVIDCWMGDIDDLDQRKKIFADYKEQFAGKPSSWDDSQINPELHNLSKLGEVIRNRRKKTVN